MFSFFIYFEIKNMPKIKYRTSTIKLHRYICIYCKKRYIQKGTLNRHIKINHTN